MPADPRRVIADLRELDRRTGGPDGARRVCWTGEWRAARAFLRERLAELDGVSVEEDEAGNLWARLGGRRDETVALGSHLDSVPNGGWLDGALGVMAALEAMRVAAEEGAERSVALVDFADEEGARFGRSLFGSSAVAGTLDPAAVAELIDADGTPIREVLAEYGVDLDAAPRAERMREGLAAYLELHIEQGPVLESEGIPAAAVTGTVGVERRRFHFEGQTAHAGTTPMDMRRDAGVAAAAGIVAITARPAEGVTTVGSMRLEPGVPTAVPGAAEIVVDLRNPTAAGLAKDLADVRAALDQIARDRGCHLSGSPVWSIEPIAFDQRIVDAVRAATGSGRQLASGALHDAAEMARHVPTGMVFTSSTAGLSHTMEEDTPEPHLERAIAAYADVARQLIAGGIV